MQNIETKPLCGGYSGLVIDEGPSLRSANARRMQQSSPSDIGFTGLRRVKDCDLDRNLEFSQASSEFSDAGVPEGRSVADVFTALGYGLSLVERCAMLVKLDGAPFVANQAAMDMLRKKDGLSLSKRGLVADRASDTRVLISLLREAITFPKKGEPIDSPLSISRKSGRSDLVVRVVPGPDLSASPVQGTRTALITISDSGRSLKVSGKDLTRLYGLTRGEAALANLMIQGKTIEEASSELFISAHTGRTHLKRIFLKTDTHRQPELVVRLLSTIL